MYRNRREEYPRILYFTIFSFIGGALIIGGIFIASFAGAIAYYFLWKRYRFEIKSSQSIINIVFLITQTYSMLTNYKSHHITDKEYIAITLAISIIWLICNFFIWRKAVDEREKLEDEIVEYAIRNL